MRRRRSGATAPGQASGSACSGWRGAIHSGRTVSIRRPMQHRAMSSEYGATPALVAGHEAGASPAHAGEVVAQADAEGVEVLDIHVDDAFRAAFRSREVVFAIVEGAVEIFRLEMN